jgi:C1A family cysteine protease
MKRLWLGLLLMSQVSRGETFKDERGIEHGLGFRKSFTDIYYHQEYEALPTDNLPAAFDSRAKGWVSPVKDQGQCGSCWAHSLTENLEDALLKAGKGSFNLSVQQVVDCDSQAAGCNGGDMYEGEYLVNYGLTKAQLYPYTAKDGRCKNPLPPIAAKPASWKFVGAPGRAPKVEELKAALVAHGSLFVTVAAGGYNWGGHQPMTWCWNSDVNHMVEIVGWNADGQWIMRNSWGTSWGDKGFGYLPFGCDSIASTPDSAGFLVL